MEAGANYVDVNCGTMVYNEVETMEWLVNTIQEATEAPLCIDSPNPKALEAGLALCKYGQPMINSISDEKERYPNVHFTCGLSNVSYGLPNRIYLNSLFVVQTMTVVWMAIF